MRKRLFSFALVLFIPFLLSACASRNDVCESCIERTDERLMDAAAGLYPDAVRRILDEGADVNAKDRYGETPLMKALRQPASRSLEQLRPMETTVAVLLDEGADVDVVGKSGTETLRLVQETNNPAVLRLFNDHISSEKRNLLFMRTLAAHQYEAALFLLHSGADPSQANEKKQSALHLAVNAYSPHPELVNRLLETNDVNMTDDYGTTPVMTACANGAPVGIVRQLLDRGAKINSRFNGKSLLYLALTAERENVALVKYLLDNGLSANDTAPDNTPLLVLAARSDRIHSVLALANAGADLSVLEKYGEDAWRARLSILSF